MISVCMCISEHMVKTLVQGMRKILIPKCENARAPEVNHLTYSKTISDNILTTHTTCIHIMECKKRPLDLRTQNGCEKRDRWI